jgi:hypothetical protein
MSVRDRVQPGCARDNAGLRPPVQRDESALSVACAEGRWSVARWLIDEQDVDLVSLLCLHVWLLGLLALNVCLCLCLCQSDSPAVYAHEEVRASVSPHSRRSNSIKCPSCESLRIAVTDMAVVGGCCSAVASAAS